MDFGNVLSSFFPPDMATAQSAIPAAPHQQVMNYYRATAPLRVANMMARTSEYGPGRGMRQMGGGANPLMSQGSLDPSILMSPEFQAQANALLGKYGLSLPQQVGPNAILPNTGYFGNHPHLSGAIEGAIYGAMATPPNSQTVGEGITNALIGGFGGQAMRRQSLTNQLMQPFGAAQQIEQLQDLQQKRDLNKAMIDRYKSEADIQQQRLQMQQDLADERAQNSRPQPFQRPDGSTGFLVRDPGSPAGWKNAPELGAPIPKNEPNRNATEIEEMRYGQWLKDNNLQDSSKNALRFRNLYHANERQAAGPRANPFTFFLENQNNPAALNSLKNWYNLSVGGATTARNEASQPFKDSAAKQRFFTSGAGADPVKWRQLGAKDKQGNRISFSDKQAMEKWYDDNLPRLQQDSQGIEVVPLPTSRQNPAQSQDNSDSVTFKSSSGATMTFKKGK